MGNITNDMTFTTGINQLKLKRKIAISILLFTFIPLIILGSFYISFIWQEKINETLDIYGKQLKSSVDAVNNLYISDLGKISNISNNFQIQNFLSTDFKDDMSAMLTSYTYIKDLFEAFEADNIKNSFCVYSLGNLQYSSEYIRNIEQLDGNVKTELINSKEIEIIWKTEYSSDYELNGNEGSVAIYRKILSLDRPLGIIETKIHINKIIESFQFELPQKSFIVYQGDNEAIINLKSNNIEQEDISNAIRDYNLDLKTDRYYILCMDVNVNLHKVLMFIPKSLIFKELSGFIFLTFCIFLISICLIFFSVTIVSMLLTHRLSSLVAKLNKDIDKLIYDGELNIDTGDDEFSIISLKFYELIKKVKEYYEQISGYDLERNVLKLQLLQERFNPHFLYNTLSSIKWAFSNDKLSEIIDSMVKFYRLALNKGNEILKISSELEMIREYLTIQKFAFDLNLEYTIQIDERIYDCLITKHLLQPFVENAILHGINGLKSQGLIKITGRFEGKNIKIEISDNGVGIPQEKLDQILQFKSNIANSGYGIRNVQKQIEPYFGADYGIDIISSVNEGTTVIITIPPIYDDKFFKQADENQQG